MRITLAELEAAAAAAEIEPALPRAVVAAHTERAAHARVEQDRRDRLRGRLAQLRD